MTDLPSLFSIFDRYPDTDKDGSLPTDYHSYASTYEQLLTPLRLTAKKVLEVGVRGGGSLKSWRDFFPAAHVHGIDNGEEKGHWIPDCDRISVHYGDSTKPETLHAVAAAHGPFDWICDDGNHNPQVQIATFAALRPFVAPGGLYCIEDVEGQHVAEQLQKLFGGTVYDLRGNKGRHDDILLVFRN